MVEKTIKLGKKQSEIDRYTMKEVGTNYKKKIRKNKEKIERIRGSEGLCRYCRYSSKYQEDGRTALHCRLGYEQYQGNVMCDEGMSPFLVGILGHERPIRRKRG